MLVVPRASGNIYMQSIEMKIRGDHEALVSMTCEVLQ